MHKLVSVVVTIQMGLSESSVPRLSSAVEQQLTRRPNPDRSTRSQKIAVPDRFTGALTTKQAYELLLPSSQMDKNCPPPPPTPEDTFFCWLLSKERLPTKQKRTCMLRQLSHPQLVISVDSTMERPATLYLLCPFTCNFWAALFIDPGISDVRDVGCICPLQLQPYRWRTIGPSFFFFWEPSDLLLALLVVYVEPLTRCHLQKWATFPTTTPSTLFWWS